MKRIALFLGSLIASTSGLRADIVISQYYEGTSNNKYIELHNPTAASITLTGYRLTLWINAAAENWKADAASPGQNLDLSAVTIPAGGYFLLAHASAALPDYANSSANIRNGVINNFNGNDSVVLYNSSTYNVANILDAVSITATNEGMDRSFYRLTNNQGYSTVAGESILTFPAVWGEKTLAEVASATAADPWYLRAQVANTPPILDSFSVANDAAASAVQGVVLTFTASGASATEYQVSESPTFAGAVWQPFSAVPKFILSAGPGTKTVYFKLQNAGGPSSALSDNIDLTAYNFPGTVVITQYYEGVSNNKHLEIANLSAAPVDLAAWNVVRWTNQEAENWKFTGAAAAGTSQTTSLAGVNTDGGGSTVLAPGAVTVFSNGGAAGPAGAAAPALVSASFNHNGNDSLALYSGGVDPANLMDVASFTDSGNEGLDKSFVRIATGQGFNFAAGSEITDFPAVWQEVVLATADAAVAGQNEHLGTYPGGPLTGYALWASGFPGIGGPNNDADGDRLTNLLEYALGSDPTDRDSAQFPVASASQRTYSFTKGAQAAADPKLTYSAEGSANMTDWSATNNIVNGPGHGGNNVVRQYTGAGRFFWRLIVTLAP